MVFNFDNFKGVCATEISFELRNGRIYNTAFHNSCHGNTQGISNLVEGMQAEDVVRCLRGIKCSGKNTSCPDKFAQCVENALATI